MIDITDIERRAAFAAAILKTLSNEKRLLIVCALYKGEKNVSELTKILKMKQSAVSQHLARLREDGVVSIRRDRQAVYYSLNEDATRAILNSLYDICVPPENSKPKS